MSATYSSSKYSPSSVMPPASMYDSERDSCTGRWQVRVQVARLMAGFMTVSYSMGVNRPRRACRRPTAILALDPRDDRDPELLVGLPPLAVQGCSSAVVRRTIPWPRYRRQHRPGPSSRGAGGGSEHARRSWTGTGSRAPSARCNQRRHRDEKRRCPARSPPAAPSSGLGPLVEHLSPS